MTIQKKEILTQYDSATYQATDINVMQEIGIKITVPSGIPNFVIFSDIPIFFSQLEILVPNAAEEDDVVSAIRKAGNIFFTKIFALTFSRNEV